MSLTESAPLAGDPASPRFAYLLLTHNQPAQVEELASRILTLSPDAEVVVHHDLAADDVPWNGRAEPPVHLVERGRVRWGDWSMIEATQRLLKYSVANLTSDWFVLLSGEHRPTTPLRRWEGEVARSGNDAYLPAERLTGRIRFGRTHIGENLYLTRILHSWMMLARPRSAFVHRGIGGIMKLSETVQPLFALEFVHRRDAWVVGFRRRRRPVENLSLFRGSQWIALNRRAALAALDVDPRLTAWFKRSWIPDETYFHTVLRNIGLSVSDIPTTFVLETPEHPTAGWMRLALEDLPAVWRAETPFARKVDPSTRPEVAAAIDEVVDQRQMGGLPTHPE